MRRNTSIHSKNYDWNQKSDIKYSIKMKRGHSGAHYKIEIAVAGKNAKQYRLMHDKIYINSDDAIEITKFISFGQNETVLTNS
jgi:hypothetical protein